MAFNNCCLPSVKLNQLGSWTTASNPSLCYCVESETRQGSSQLKYNCDSWNECCCGHMIEARYEGSEGFWERVPAAEHQSIW